jgi:hypothetical protein
VVLIDRKCSVTTNFIRRLKQTQQGQELLDWLDTDNKILTVHHSTRTVENRCISPLKLSKVLNGGRRTIKGKWIQISHIIRTYQIAIKIQRIFKCCLPLLLNCNGPP